MYTHYSKRAMLTLICVLSVALDSMVSCLVVLFYTRSFLSSLQSIILPLTSYTPFFRVCVCVCVCVCVLYSYGTTN
jgi:hypothetical protein